MKSHATSRKNLLRRQLGLVVILFAGFAASLGLYHFFNYTEARRTGDEFLRRASVRHALINESIRGYEECLHNLKNLFTNSEDVSPAEFTATALDIRTRHRGIQALQWVPVIPGDLRAETEAWARREIAPSYTFTERGPDGSLVPAADRPAYHPILYTDPVAGNEAALGFDLRVGPSRDDLARSLESRALVLTRKIRLVQEDPGVDRYGVIMACPVFIETAGQPPQLRGFVQIVFKIDSMLEQSWLSYPANALDTLVLDLTQPARHRSVSLQPSRLPVSRRASFARSLATVLARHPPRHPLHRRPHLGLLLRPVHRLVRRTIQLLPASRPLRQPPLPSASFSPPPPPLPLPPPPLAP